jgi:hypothetical protein
MIKFPTETQMFGCSTETVKEDATRYNNPTMYVMGTLSDAQEMVFNGNTEGARQAMNRAKYAVTEFLVAAPRSAPTPTPAAPEFPMLTSMGYRNTTIYTESETEAVPFKAAVTLARAMFAEDAAKARDTGTCTLGSGICIRVRPPRARTRVEQVTVVSAEGRLQGNVAKYESALRAYSYLRAQGIDCFWNDGAMD